MSLLEQHDFDYMYPMEKRIEDSKQYIQDLTEDLANAKHDATKRLIKNALEDEKKRLANLERDQHVTFIRPILKEL